MESRLILGCLLAGSVCWHPLVPSLSAADRPPNVALVYADDLGYGDIGAYGARTIRTPQISSAVQAEPAMTIDVLPTIAALVGAPLPARPIDGLDISTLLLAEKGARSPHDALFFYYGTELRAVRSGRHKLVLPHRSDTLDGAPGLGGRPGKYRKTDVPLALYDLVADIGEVTDVAAQHPDVLARLLALVERARDDLGDSLTQRTGRGVREPGRVP